MKAEEIMSSPVVTVGLDASLRDAVGAMLKHRVGCVVVVDEMVAGILTRSDGLRVAYREGESLAAVSVEAAMTRDVVTTRSSVSVETVLRTIAEHEVKKLPVVADLELVGIVTMTDVARTLPNRVQELRATLDRQDDWTD